MHTTFWDLHYDSLPNCSCCWLAFVALGSDLPPAHLHHLFMTIPLSLVELNWALSIYLWSMAKFGI